MSKPMKWLVVLILTGVAFGLALITGRTSMFFTLFLPMAVVMTIVITLTTRRKHGKAR